MARTKVRRFAIAAFASMAVAAGGLATAAPASATGSGSCFSSAGDGCLYYDYNYTGGNYGINNSRSNLLGIAFGGCNYSSCDGDGIGVSNNAASAADFDSSYNWCIYYNSEWAGSTNWYAAYGNPGWYGNLTNTYKNDASDLFMTGSC